MVPGKAGWITAARLQSCVHVTPVRASRALALRYLSHRFAVPLDRFVIAVPTPTAKEEEVDRLLVSFMLCAAGVECVPSIQSVRDCHCVLSDVCRQQQM